MIAAIKFIGVALACAFVVVVVGTFLATLGVLIAEFWSVILL
jgi:hypothetical protein